MTSLLEKLGFIKNLGVGEIQSDDEMTVIPLVGDGLGKIAPPADLHFVRTTTYGTMKYENQSDQPAIIPSHMMVRGKDAQDHSMSGSGVLLPMSSRLFDNACCIESSQEGYFEKNQMVESDILPVELRRSLLDSSLRSHKSYDKLWEGIKNWLQSLKGVTDNRRAHLRDFYDNSQYKNALETFAAAFEPVENQIGALILFNGLPVGLEIMPSADHWLAYWKWLIRGCYGSQLIKLRETNELPRSTLMVLPNIPKNADGEEVVDIMDSFIKNIHLSIVPMLNLIKINSVNNIDVKNNMITEMIRTDRGGGGDVITQDSQPVYISLIL